jgi:hypothetical protein
MSYSTLANIAQRAKNVQIHFKPLLAMLLGYIFKISPGQPHMARWKIETNSKIVRNCSLDHTYGNCE